MRICRRWFLYAGAATVLTGGVTFFVRHKSPVQDESVRQEFRNGIVTIRNGIIVAPSETSSAVGDYEEYFRSMEK